ncbi:hypothetical protein Dimus_020259 [Dionaea muscipula]
MPWWSLMDGEGSGGPMDGEFSVELPVAQKMGSGLAWDGRWCPVVVIGVAGLGDGGRGAHGEILVVWRFSVGDDGRALLVRRRSTEAMMVAVVVSRGGRLSGDGAARWRPTWWSVGGCCCDGLVTRRVPDVVRERSAEVKTKNPDGVEWVAGVKDAGGGLGDGWLLGGPKDGLWSAGDQRCSAMQGTAMVSRGGDREEHCSLAIAESCIRSGYRLD